MEPEIDIEALKKGDEEQFRVLVELYQNRVFNTCFGFLGNREEAEDASQETFIAIFSAVRLFRGEAALSTWIYRIAVTTALQAIRRKRRKRQVALFFPGHQEALLMDSRPDPDERAHPLLRLENKERRDILYKELDKLPESQRVAFTLNKIEGLGYKEIGEVMNVSLSSVESLIHRAKVNLQKRLAWYYEKHA